MVVKGLIIVWLEAKMMLCDIHEAIVGQLARAATTRRVFAIEIVVIFVPS